MAILKVRNSSFSAPTSILSEACDLTPTQKLILLNLYSHANPKKGTATPSYQEQAKEIGFSDKAIRNNMKVLEEKGWIKKTNKYRKADNGTIYYDVNSYELINILAEKGTERDSLPTEQDSLPPSERDSLPLGNVVPNKKDIDLDLKRDLIDMISKLSDLKLIKELLKRLKTDYPNTTEDLVIETYNLAVDKEPKHFENYLATALIKNAKATKPKTERSKIKQDKPKRKRNSIRTEIVPDWLESPNQAEAPKKDSKSIDEERARLEKELAEFKKKKKSS